MLACLLSLAGSALLLAGGCGDTLDPFDRLPPGPRGRLVVTDTLVADADTYIRQSPPNANWGADTALQLGGGGRSRVLVRFDSTALRQAVGTGMLDSAWLEFTITAGPQGWGTNERTVDLHRLLKDWTELGATWNCAVDANTANSVPDCPTQGWDMTSNGNGTYAASKTDRVKVSNGQTGVLRLGVTADVAAFLGGTQLHQGWVFRKTSESQGGEAIIFSRESGSQPRLVVSVTQTFSVPAFAPDTLPAWFDQDTSYSNNGTGFLKGVISLAFRQGTSQSARQAAVDLVHGTVVGGIPFATGDGYYHILVADDGTGDQLRAAVAALEQLPQVEAAALVYRLSPGYLKAEDAAGWTRSDWVLNPDSANGPNWALEEINAPLAWGCTAGDTVPKVWVIDHAFDATEMQLNLRLPAPAFGQYPLDQRHGTQVASILAAKGDNQLGITGGMWTAAVHLEEVGAASARFDLLAAHIERAGIAGAELVNFSWYYRWLGATTDTAIARRTVAAMMVPLRRAQAAGKLPVVVTIAGNEARPAWDAIVPQLRDSFPQRFIVVGGSRRHSPPMRPRDAWPQSNTGPLVDVYAPGDSVWALINIANQASPVTGTSFSAPQVTAIGGLLKSFDPSLPLDSLKTLILGGAQKGGRLIMGSAYLANAYESLKLAAERPGAPLCGNRLWTEGSLVKVQRGAVTDTLRDVGAQLLNVTAMHGGKRVLYTTLSGTGALQYQNGAWVLAAQLPGDTLFNGVTSSVSHDGDSVAAVCCWGGGPLTVEIGAVGAPPAYTHTVPLPGRTSNLICEMELNGTCLQYFDAGLEYSPYPADDDPGYSYSIQYSTAGDEVYLSVPTWVQHIASQGPPTTCPFSPNPALLCYPISLGWQVTGATVYAINIRTGASRTIDTSTGGGIWQVGVSESNQQMASVRGAYQYAYVRRWWLGTSGGPYGSFNSCTWEFTPINGVTGPPVQSFPLPAGSVCTGTPFRGTFAPIRRAALRR